VGDSPDLSGRRATGGRGLLSGRRGRGLIGRSGTKEVMISEEASESKSESLTASSEEEEEEVDDISVS
jgi:hypothetical protein